MTKWCTHRMFQSFKALQTDSRTDCCSSIGHSQAQFSAKKQLKAALTSASRQRFPSQSRPFSCPPPLHLERRSSALTQTPADTVYQHQVSTVSKQTGGDAQSSQIWSKEQGVACLCCSLEALDAFSQFPSKLRQLAWPCMSRAS